MAVTKKRRHRSPAQILVLGFAALVVIGALLLVLPAASANGVSIGFVDAVFTSTSSVCVVGLTLFDIGAGLSLFGQIVVMVLMQIGGIGFMTMTSLVYMLSGRKLTLHDRMMISYNFNDSPLQSVALMTRNVAIITGIAEGIGALLFMTRFIPMFGVTHGVYYSVFQSVSAFCNVGYDVFGTGDGIMFLSGDVLVNVVTMALTVLGGLGFFVVVELFGKITRRQKKRLSLHSRIVLVVSGVLIVGSFAIFLLVESRNMKTLGDPDMPAYEKVLGALNQAVHSRSSGFYTMHQPDMMPLSQVVTIGLMFIGAAPASTGGGVKVTTLALVVLFVISVLKGKEDVEVAERRINKPLVLRGVAIAMLAIVYVVLVTAVIFVLESGEVHLIDIAFEVTACFGTTGFTMNLIPLFTIPSQILMVFTMFAGRLGIFTLALALARQSDTQKVDIRYPEDKIMIG